MSSKEGAVTAFYRGLSPNLLGNSVSWALYFVSYDRLKSGIQAYHGRSYRLSYYDFFLASGAAGITFRSLPDDPKKVSNFFPFLGTFTTLCTNPIWVIKTRMLSTSSNYPGAYMSIADGTRQIFRSEGLWGFYNGLVPSLFGVSHGALQFMAYEKLKISRRGGTAQRERDLHTLDFLLLSGLAKIFATVVSYPYQVIRARLQIYGAGKVYTGSRDVVSQVWRHEGIKGFYKGLAPNLLRVMPSTWVTFLVYEKTRLHLPDLLGHTITT